MKLKSVALAAALVLGGISAASADTLTDTVRSWDGTTRQVTLSDGTKLKLTAELLSDVSAIEIGTELVINYEGGENGIEKVTGVLVKPKS